MLRNQMNLFELANFPKPPALQTLLNGISPNLEVVLAETFKLLQFAAVHLQSTAHDENIFEGRWVEDVDEIHRGTNGLQVLMCSVKMAMNQAGIPVDRTVDHALKSVDVTPIGDSSRRNLRDILRLTGTQKILIFVHNMFSKLRERREESQL